MAYYKEGQPTWYTMYYDYPAMNVLYRIIICSLLKCVHNVNFTFYVSKADVKTLLITGDITPVIV